jgi:hypothetical protein
MAVRGWLCHVQFLATGSIFRRGLLLFAGAAEAMRAQTEAQRRLGGAQRFRTACMMSQTLRDLAIARMHSMHPELDERGVLDRLLAELYGFRRIT